MKTDIRLIALDLDGTLLDSQKRLSARNEKVLRECIARGIYVVPCTGRIWSGVPEFLRTLPGIRYAITTNGAIVEDVEKHRILDERKLSCAQAIEILELAEKFHTMYDAYVDGYAYGERRFLEHMDEYAIPDTIQNMIHQTRREVPDVIEKVRDTGLPVEKINYFFGDQQERARARRELQERGDVIVSSSLDNNLEINAQGATKGEAILRLAKHLGLSRKQTMGFGDGENDMTMIRMAGIGVAMGNAVEALKTEADYVTVTNDEDGVADAIEKLVLSAD
ncbi:MAG: Cof-type HAD-IIB family hydrolase [Lachnospiraceae bacterium]